MRLWICAEKKAKQNILLTVEGTGTGLCGGTYSLLYICLWSLTTWQETGPCDWKLLTVEFISERPMHPEPGSSCADEYPGQLHAHTGPNGETAAVTP